jgi:DNA-binding NtrC family response regulator
MEPCRILFVDDDHDILIMVEQYLSQAGYSITTVDNGVDALGIVKEEPIDIVFTDFKMPQFSGLELLAAIKQHKPETEVIIVTGYGSMESAIQAMRFGAYDYLQKPFKMDHLKLIVDRISEEKKFTDKAERIRRRAPERHRYEGLVGISPKMQEIYELIEAVSRDLPMVLIQGESGTGKQLVANTIHQKSRRAKAAFVPVNCGSLPADSPSEKIAADLRGLVTMADGGTLYLDEIAELDPALRHQLQDLLQNSTAGVDKQARGNQGVHVIAGTAREIDDVVKSGALGKGLINLLDTVMIRIPPLRERKEDICLLINHFIHQVCQRQNKGCIGVSPEALDILLGYHWPGNLIQLQNVIERAFALGVRDMVRPDDLPAEIRTFAEVSKL